MSTTALNDFVRRVTVAYRKGEEVTVTENGAVRVIEINGYPTAPDSTGVDVHFLMIGFTPEVDEITPLEFVDMIVDAETGEWMSFLLDEFKQGPSYITIGAWLGSQDQALRFMALGEHYGLWHVITPAKLGATGERADKMAGTGFVMISGLKVPE